jgi:outer membrane immunogenic protein
VATPFVVSVPSGVTKMKKLLLSTAAFGLALSASAFAADLPNRKAPVFVPPPPPATWTGFYVGLNLGGGWNANSGQALYSAYWDPRFAFGSNVGGTPNLFFLSNGNSSGNAGGVVGGGQIGYNYQFGQQIVAGVEADIQGTSIGGNGAGSYGFYPTIYAPVANNFLAPVSAINGSRVGLPWFGTVRGRLGYLVTPTILIYGTGGFAYGGVEAWGYNNTRTGWAAGGGVEWMFARNWSAKLEYLYADLSGGGAQGGFGWNYGYRFHPKVNVVRAGVNYHFDFGMPAPVLAKY